MKKILLLVTTLVATTAVAQTERAPPPAADDTGYKANMLICRTVHESGSRLRRHRVCATRMQWDEQKRTDRAHVERAQLNKIRP